MTSISPPEWVLYITSGAAVGVVYFALLLRTVRLHSSRASVGHIIALYAIRMIAAISVFWLVAQNGALPLLLALMGFLAARIAIQRFAGARS
jgi:F1F0 ATPase subunit 2